jgi:hypothetical protein
MVGVQFVGEIRYFSLLHIVQTGSGVRLAYYPIGTGDSFSGTKAAVV